MHVQVVSSGRKHFVEHRIIERSAYLPVQTFTGFRKRAGVPQDFKEFAVVGVGQAFYRSLELRRLSYLLGHDVLQGLQVRAFNLAQE